ncbi:MAG: DUF2207 domain-containing protein [Ruminococcaceae bacterium]|nr:DUF2207 domain-containing protein [Oscillospiraceae bacterium]
MKKGLNMRDISAKQKLTEPIDEVPLYRAYGVKKRVTIFTRINDLLPPILAVILFSLYGMVLFAGVWALVTMLGYIGIMLCILGFLAFVYFFVLRTVRKRLKFIRKLKRRCKTLGFKIKKLRSFRKGFKNSTEGFDFTVDTGKKCYCVRYYTSTKYLTHITFIDEETIAIKRNITKSHFKLILGFNNPKTKYVKYSFKDTMNVYNRKTQKVLLLNPVPHDCFKKDADGSIIPIGTGEHICDYIVYSGTSFINTLSRESGEV